jgi:hypothetical protein
MSAILDPAARLDAQRARDLDLTDATIRAIHRASHEADEIAAENQARKEMLTEQLQAEIDRGDAYSTCFFASKRSVRCKDGGYVTIQENLGHVLADGLDVDDSISFHHVADYLLELANEGDETAQQLLTAMRDAWVKVNA